MIKFKKFFPLVILIIVLLITAACGNTTTDTQGEDPIRIGIAMKTEVQPRWKYDVGYMEERAKELNAELIIQWANDDVTRQGNQVENLITQGIDVLVIVPVTDQTGNLVQMAKDEDISVIAYDALPQDADVDLFVTRDNYRVGELQMEAAIEYTGGEGNFVILKGDPPTTVAQDIARAYDDILSDYENINIVSEQWHRGWSTEEALATAENALSAQSDDIQAFVSSNDGMAVGVSQAVKGRGLDGEVFISGMDVELGSARLIAEGTQTMSIWTMIDQAARDTITAAVDLANNVEIEADSTTNNGFKDVPTLFADVVTIDQDNLCEFINEIAPSGWMSAEEVFGDDIPKPDNCR